MRLWSNSRPCIGFSERAMLPLFTLVILVSLLRYLHTLTKLLFESPFIDFAFYYTHTTVVALGRNPFDPEAVAWVDNMLNIRRAGGMANYPPFFYLLMQPWVLLPFRSAAVAWFLTMQACLLGTLVLCFRRFPTASSAQKVAALFVVLNYQPLMEDLALGQSNVMLLFLATLSWWSLRTGHPMVAVGAIALTVHIKVQYGLLIPLLWWTGHYRVSLWALILAGLGLGLGVVILGTAHYLSYLQYLLSLPDHPLTWTLNLSPRATLQRLCVVFSHGQVIANGLTLALDAVLLALFMRGIPRIVPTDSPAMDWFWGLGLAAVLLLSPFTEEHHLVVLLLPVTLLLLGESGALEPPREILLLVSTILLLGSRYSLERFPDFHQGVYSLLTIGKLLGVAGLAWTLIRRLQLARNIGR